MTHNIDYTPKYKRTPAQASTRSKQTRASQYKHKQQ